MSCFVTLILFLVLGFQTAWAQPDFAARNQAKIQKIYDLTLYPNNIAFLTQGIKALPPGIFNENVRGRVSPLGNFTGLEDTAEYFFALSPANPSAPTLIRAQLVGFQSACPQVASSIVYLYTGFPKNSTFQDEKVVSVLKQVVFWRFDDSGAVLYYDAWIENLALWTQFVNGVDFANPAIQSATIEATCQAVQARCTGPNQQYSSLDDCIANYHSKPVGNYDEVWGDNVVCRTVHIRLTPLRPDVHCPHVGPTGGGKCVDINYNDAYFDDDANLFRGPRGSTFVCPPPKSRKGKWYPR